MASRKPQTLPSVRHPSHNHPLRGHKAKFEDEIICFGCNLDLIGASYKCTKSVCDYFLHKSCFELPREIRHKSHPNHPLTLLHSPPYDHSTYTCNACGEYGSGFTYNCSICQYDVHVGCVSMPESMKHDKHVHPLALVYSSAYPKGITVTCGVCHETIPQNRWSYFCQLCRYNSHLHSCIADKEEKPCVDDEVEKPLCNYNSHLHSCVADKVEEPCVADEVEEPCVADEVEEPCVADEVKEQCVADEVEEPCVADEEEEQCVADEEEEQCVADEEEEPCVADELEEQCVADKEEEQCVADEEEEPCVADEEEGPENEGRMRKRDIARLVANVGSIVIGFGPLF